MTSKDTLTTQFLSASVSDISRSVQRKSKQFGLWAEPYVGDMFTSFKYFFTAAAFYLTTDRAGRGHENLRLFIPRWKITLIFIGVMLATFGPIIILCTSLLLDVYQFDDASTCLPNGELALFVSSPNYIYFDPALILDITLGFGRLSFSSVKIIDVIWDVVVGRGGQALLAWLLYLILSQALLHSMEIRSVSFERFAATSYNPDSLKAFWILCQDVPRTRAAQTRPLWILLGSVYVCLYLMAYPTVVSSITGYSAVSEAYVWISDNTTLVRIQDLRTVSAVVHDGSRIGLSDGFAVAGLEFPFEDGFSSSSTLTTVENDTFTQVLNYYGMSRYWVYGSYPYNQMEFDCSTYATKNANEPSLNCPPQACSSNITIDDKYHPLTAPTLDITYYNPYTWGPTTLYWYNNATLTNAQVSVRSQCNPTSQYQWGFSFLGVFIFLIFTAIYTQVLFFIWYDTYRNSRNIHPGLGVYRSTLDMAAALRKDMGDDCGNMSNAEMEKQVRETGLRMRFDVDASQLSRAQILRRVGEGKGQGVVKRSYVMVAEYYQRSTARARTTWTTAGRRIPVVARYVAEETAFERSEHGVEMNQYLQRPLLYRDGRTTYDGC